MPNKYYYLLLLLIIITLVMLCLLVHSRVVYIALCGAIAHFHTREPQSLWCNSTICHQRAAKFAVQQILPSKSKHNQQQTTHLQKCTCDRELIQNDCFSLRIGSIVDINRAFFNILYDITQNNVVLFSVRDVLWILMKKSVTFYVYLLNCCSFLWNFCRERTL